MLLYIMTAGFLLYRNLNRAKAAGIPEQRATQTLVVGLTATLIWLLPLTALASLTPQGPAIAAIVVAELTAFGFGMSIQHMAVHLLIPHPRQTGKRPELHTGCHVAGKRRSPPVSHNGRPKGPTPPGQRAADAGLPPQRASEMLYLPVAAYRSIGPIRRARAAGMTVWQSRRPAGFAGAVCSLFAIAGNYMPGISCGFLPPCRPDLRRTGTDLWQTSPTPSTPSFPPAPSSASSWATSEGCGACAALPDA